MNQILNGIDLKALIQRAAERGLCSAPVKNQPRSNYEIHKIRRQGIGLTQRGTLPVDRSRHSFNAQFSPKAGGLKINTIKRCVAGFYRIPVTVLTSPKRTETVAWARHVAFFFIREFLDEPLTRIGLEFKGVSKRGCDHSTVIYGITRVKDAVASHQSTAQEIDILRAKIKEVLR